MENLVYNSVQSFVTIGFLIATVTLVYVTQYHANISAKIVEEEKKGREVEFEEKCIKESLRPTMSILMEIKYLVSGTEENPDTTEILKMSKKLHSKIRELNSHLFNNLFLTEIGLHVKIQEYIDDSLRNHEGLMKRIYSIIDCLKYMKRTEKLDENQLEKKRNELKISFKEWKPDFVKETDKILNLIIREIGKYSKLISDTYGKHEKRIKNNKGDE